MWLVRREREVHREADPATICLMACVSPPCRRPIHPKTHVCTGCGLLQIDEPDGVHVEGPIRVVWRPDVDHEETDVAQSAIVDRGQITLVGTASGEAELVFNSAGLVSITPEE